MDRDRRQKRNRGKQPHNCPKPKKPYTVAKSFKEWASKSYRVNCSEENTSNVKEV